MCLDFELLNEISCLFIRLQSICKSEWVPISTCWFPSIVWNLVHNSWSVCVSTFKWSFVFLTDSVRFLYFLLAQVGSPVLYTMTYTRSGYASRFGFLNKIFCVFIGLRSISLKTRSSFEFHIGIKYKPRNEFQLALICFPVLDRI